MDKKYDFGGFATKFNIKCADGRTIRKDAFKMSEGETVPLVWGHKHGSPGDVLGHAVLENRDDGVYAYGFFNDTESGRNAKELVRHGDIRALSIYANNLVQKGKDVLHGMIREVSLCLAGANPGARIEDLSFSHDADEDCDDFEALIFNGENIELQHSDESFIQPMVDIPDLETIYAQAALQHQMMQEQMMQEQMLHQPQAYPDYSYQMPAYQDVVTPPVDIQHANDGSAPENDDRTVKDVYDSMSEDEKGAINYMIRKASGAEDDSAEDAAKYAAVFENMSQDKKNVAYYMIGDVLGQDEKEEPEVAHNVFDSDYANSVLIHDAFNNAMKTVLADAPKMGSLRKAYEYHMSQGGALAHAIDTTGMTVPDVTNAEYANTVGYGINDMSFLFPEARELNTPPEFIKRDTDWVDVVLAGVNKRPFSRIKTTFANITEDEARAKGYIKGKLKKEEFFSLMKRVTTPTTIYKKQRFDRDDVVDITDFNVVAWVKTEMRMMLNEELCRAILIGDGRALSDDDKINEGNIRPIVKDENLFTIKRYVTAGATEEETAKNAIKEALRARKDYKGSGNPTFFTTEDWLTSMLLIEDGIGRRLYDTETEVAAAIRARRIVTVPLMEEYKDDAGNELIGIFVNLNDYAVGTDKGGEINMFDDFDIDYNRYKYMIETRCSGTLIKPYSAIALFKKASTTPTPTPNP